MEQARDEMKIKKPRRPKEKRVLLRHLAGPAMNRWIVKHVDGNTKIEKEVVELAREFVRQDEAEARLKRKLKTK
jgi:hypothetical protein